MQQGSDVSGPILRFFEVRTKPGRASELLRNFATTSAEVVRGKPGNQGYFFGQEASGDEDVVVFASVWANLKSIQDHFGDDWQRSYLPEGYEDLISECSVRHLDLNQGWHVSLGEPES